MVRTNPTWAAGLEGVCSRNWRDAHSSHDDLLGRQKVHGPCGRPRRPELRVVAIQYTRPSETTVERIIQGRPNGAAFGATTAGQWQVVSPMSLSVLPRGGWSKGLLARVARARRSAEIWLFVASASPSGTECRWPAMTASRWFVIRCSHAPELRESAAEGGDNLVPEQARFDS